MFALQVAAEKTRQEEDAKKMEQERYDGKLKGGFNFHKQARPVVVNK